MDQPFPTAASRKANGRAQSRSAPAASSEKTSRGSNTAELISVLRDTCAAIATAHRHHGNLEFRACDGSCVVPSDMATVLALIVAEAVTNAIKHSHPTGVWGKVVVSCGRDKQDGIAVHVVDDGVGLPEEFDTTSDGSDGFGVMRALSKKLGAALSFESTTLGLTVGLRVPNAGLSSQDEEASAAPMTIGANGLYAPDEPTGLLGLFDALPVAVYATDAVGRITFYNEAASALWGCRPELGSSEFCGSWKLYWPDGTTLPHEECPMAMALAQKRPIRGMEAIAERPDGSRVSFIPHPTPLFDGLGELAGAVNTLIDVSDRKAIETALARHRDEQSALYLFTDKLFRAVSPADAYAAALDAIEQALGCRRSSILLFDEAGVMRFVASRGLSDGYRKAVEGHSPWTRQDKDPQPICIEDVANSDLAKSLKEVVSKECIGALAFIPLMARGELIGKFMTYHDGPHVFAPMQLDLALTIARQLGFGLEHLRGERASRLLSSIVQNSDDAIVSKNLNSIVTSWNRAAEQLFGYTAEEMIGKSITLLIPDGRQNEEPEILNRIRRGERIEHYETIRQCKDGSLIDVSLSISPVLDAGGKVVGASKIARNITERKEAGARQQLLTREIQHRTKNLFAVVQAVVARSFVGKQTVKEAQAAVLDRLRSLAQTHVMLMDKEWQGAELGDVVRAEMTPYGNCVQIEGPIVQLDAKAAQNFALAVHELATNATKYGALSSPAGRVSIRWSTATSNGSRRFNFRWQEQGGPPVSAPSQKGFGSVVLEQVMADYFAEPPRIDFAAGGVCYQLNGELADLKANEG